ncbi:molybdenum cofactor guanylyltransferase [uncultured Winogradskyella sp.]|uniref:molybdenum cofactor guanylyltransferase n=1 Tax=uncultured Winogradskyella sp. TaxID=395353 RepID=UPI00260555C1|nr:molybdenum cofactor guanylyltransferase [uncultured Winogradskyella sp.]
MNKINNISVYILCGGKNIRMQKEKGLVLYKSQPFIQHIINAIKPISKKIFLVTDNNLYQKFGYPLVNDEYKDKGPVGGIYSALKHSNTHYNIILSCDIPNITTSILNTYLSKEIYQKEITFLKDEQYEYPLIGVYSKHLVSKFEEAINTNILRLLRLIKCMDYKTIEIEVNDKVYVKNINTRQELELLKYEML